MPLETSRLGVVGRPSRERARGRGIWDASPSATLLTDASMEGWGDVLHAQTGNESTPSGEAPQTRAGVHQTFGTSVPARGLFMTSGAEPTSINQMELLAAIFGLKKFLPVARQQRVQLLLDSRWLWPSSKIGPAGRRRSWSSFGSCGDFARKTAFLWVCNTYPAS
jgi:hypothetical protein